jgi:ribosomal protein S18 acetylase RimI-like enzyme
MAIIGRATLRNAPDIAEVYVDAWRSAYAGVVPDRVLVGMSCEQQTREWAYLIRRRSEDHTVMVAAEIGHGLVGVTSFGTSRESQGIPARAFNGGESGKTAGEIFTLYVQPDFQERGIGRQLLSAAFSALRQRGLERGFLWVLRDNPARFFYERMGGIPVARKKEKLWGSALDQVAYGWPDLRRAIGRIGSCSAG